MGGGDGTNSTEQNPSHGFANAWSYNVTLTVNTPGGERSVEKDNYISQNWAHHLIGIKVQ